MRRLDESYWKSGRDPWLTPDVVRLNLVLKATACSRTEGTVEWASKFLREAEERASVGGSIDPLVIRPDNTTYNILLKSMGGNQSDGLEGNPASAERMLQSMEHRYLSGNLSGSSGTALPTILSSMGMPRAEALSWRTMHRDCCGT